MISIKKNGQLWVVLGQTKVNCSRKIQILCVFIFNHKFYYERRSKNDLNNFEQLICVREL